MRCVAFDTDARICGVTDSFAKCRRQQYVEPTTNPVPRTATSIPPDAGKRVGKTSLIVGELAASDLAEITLARKREGK